MKSELGVLVKRVGQLDLKYRNLVICKRYHVSNRDYSAA